MTAYVVCLDPLLEEFCIALGVDISLVVLPPLLNADLRVLTVVDQWSRQSPILEVASSLSGTTVGLALDRVLPTSSGLRSITVDHGTEFMSRALEDWAYARGVQLDFIHTGGFHRPLKPRFSSEICRVSGPMSHQRNSLPSTVNLQGELTGAQPRTGRTRAGRDILRCVVDDGRGLCPPHPRSLAL